MLDIKQFIFSCEFYKHILVYHHDDKSSCARLSNLQKYGSVPGYKMFIVYATSNKTIRKRFQVAVWCINIYPINSSKFIWIGGKILEEFDIITRQKR